MEIGNLAIWHCMNYENVSTNLVGIQNLDDLNKNLGIMRNGITDEDKQLLREIQEK